MEELNEDNIELYVDNVRALTLNELRNRKFLTRHVAEHFLLLCDNATAKARTYVEKLKQLKCEANAS